MPPTLRSRTRRGFTLLELLIATAVAAVLLSVVQTTYFGALRLHDTTHARLEEERRVQRAAGIIRRDLAGLMLPGGETSLAGPLQTTPFAASLADAVGERITPDLSTSSGRVDGWTPFADVQTVAYFLAASPDGGAGRNLVRAVTRNLLPVQAQPPAEQVILEGVDSATLTYHDGFGWTDTWDSEATSTLPVALRFSFRLAGAPGGTAAAAPFEVVVPVLVRTTTSLAEEEGSAP